MIAIGKATVDAERAAAVERAATLAPANPKALVEIAELRHEQGKTGEALALAREAVSKAPGHPEPLDMLATVLSAAGACDQAGKMERRVLEVLPDNTGPAAAEEVRARIVSLQDRCKQNRRIKALNEASQKGPGQRQCPGSGPKLPKIALKHEEEIRLHYSIAADGSITGLSSDSKAPPTLVKAFIDYVQSCKFPPRASAVAPERGDPPEQPMEMNETYQVGKSR